MSKLSSAIIALALPALLGAQSTLDKTEKQLRNEIAKRREDQISYLEKLVNIPSGSLNVQGVRDVGNVVMATLDSLGFQSTWAEVPAEMKRGGHLVSTHLGKPGTPRRHTAHPADRPPRYRVRGPRPAI